MTQPLWVGTRKGLFRLESSDAGKSWRVAHIAFLAEPVSMVLHDPRDGAVYVALNLGHFGVKIHRSDDNGVTWTEVAAPAHPKPAKEDEKAKATSQIWALEPAGPRVEDGLWIGTIPGGLFHSKDRGATWTINSALWNVPERAGWFGGGADEPGIHSICVDPRDPRHVMIGVSCAGAWRTRDGGETWSQTAHGMIADYMPPERQLDPHVQDPHRIVQCQSNPDLMWTQHHCGVFRSVDCGVSWQRVNGLRPSAFGFGVAVHPRDGNIAWFVPAVKDQTRIPLDGKFVVSRTRDGGQSCDVLASGLPQEHCYDIVYRHALEVDATGKVLAMGSTTGHVYTSADSGDNWHRLPHFLPPIYVVRFGVK